MVLKILFGISCICIILDIVFVLFTPRFFPLFNPGLTLIYENFLIILGLALILVIFVLIGSYCELKIKELKKTQLKGRE